MDSVLCMIETVFVPFILSVCGGTISVIAVPIPKLHYKCESFCDLLRYNLCRSLESWLLFISLSLYFLYSYVELLLLATVTELERLGLFVQLQRKRIQRATGDRLKH